MPRRSSSQPQAQLAQLTLVAMQQGIDRLRKRVDEVRAFEPTSVTEQNNIPHVRALGASVNDALVRTFGSDTLDYKRYRDAGYFDNGPHNYAYRVPIEQVHASLARSKARSIALLEQAIASLEERIAEATSDLAREEPINYSAAVSRKIFLVHGHEEGPREAVARFLEKMDFTPIILHEQANQGRTIIEKFEAHANVGFAVVLLTPDDMGGPRDGVQQPRARQNVVLELGYFIGKLGRRHVCAIKSGELEMPSDIIGVVWTPFDNNGAWKAALAKELEAVGHEIDWNKAMRS
jgi:predicted nucleotide-binding protein